MAHERMSIGEVAAVTGLSVHTLRLYERDGLLAGDVQRDEAGRRSYSAWDVEWLHNCVKFRATGMPLVQIRRLAELVRDGSGNEIERLALLRRHQQHIAQRLAELHDCLDLIEAKVAGYEAHLARPVPADLQPGGAGCRVPGADRAVVAGVPDGGLPPDEAGR